MIKIFKKLMPKSPRLNPNQPEARREIIKNAVQRTVKEYGEALKKLGSE